MESSNMPRILYLASASSIHTNRWVNAISKRGYEVHLVSLHPLHDVLDPRIFFYQAPFKPNIGYFSSFLWIRRLILKIKPALIHAHYAAGYGTMAALAGFHPTILSVWGYDVYEFPKKSCLHKNLLKFNLIRADKILSTSHIMAKETAKYTHKSIAVTPFGIDLNQFTKQTILDNIFEPKDIVIGTVKTLHEKYGIKYLIKAFKLINDKYPKLPLKLLIVGSGSQEALLKNLVKDLGLTEHTVFTGHIFSYADIPKYHNMLSVYVAPSVSDSESFGVAVIEASACEKPVIVSDIGGLPEVVEDGFSGFIVPPRSEQQIAAAIEKLILDKDLRIHMGQSGRERVAKLYNWEDSVNQMTNIYDNFLKDLVQHSNPGPEGQVRVQ